MVLLERIELSTSPLPRECSTSELQQRREGASRHIRKGMQEDLDGFFRLGYRSVMSEKKQPSQTNTSTNTTANTRKTQSAREDRLKAALKANMARRKTQAKARTQETQNKTAQDVADTSDTQVGTQAIPTDEAER